MQEPEKAALFIPGRKAFELVRTPESVRESYEIVCAAPELRSKPPKAET